MVICNKYGILHVLVFFRRVLAIILEMGIENIMKGGGNINSPNYRFDELEEKIKSLQEHKIRQIDENRKISVRVDELNDEIHEIDANVQTLMDFMESIQSSYFKKPHKCPICLGIGKITIQNQPIFEKGGKYINTDSKNTCISCEGKGIVWG